MITVQQLTDLRLGKLKTAVSDWHEMVRKLRRLADGEGGDVSAAKLRARAEWANWKGENATVGKAFVTKTASQFDDAVVEAEGVHVLLSDALSRFIKHKKDLNDAIDDLMKHDIMVNVKGRVASAAPSGAAAGDVKPPTKEVLDEAQARIDKIMDAADEDDRVIARALRAYAKNKYDFSDHAVKGAADAERQQGKQDAKHWTDKIKKGDVAKWSDADVARFNEVLKRQKDNPAFAETFATGLGAEGTLQFWRDLAAPPGGAVEGERAKMLAHVQDNLSMTLAEATRSHSGAMDDWKHNMIAAGDKTFPVDPRMPAGPNGFQVMGSLMHKGKFGSDFLDGYGKAMLTYERTFPNNADPQLIWRDNANLEYPPTGRLNDPVPGFMDALGHNPQESLKFFNESTGQGDDRVSNFQYLAGHADGARDWPEGDDGKPFGYNNLGHALESATLGYAYDDKSPHIPPLDTKGQIQDHEDRMNLVQSIMDNYKSVEVIDDQAGISDSLAKIAAGNINSIDYTMDDFGGSGASRGRDDLFHSDQNHLRDFSEGRVVHFLRAVASDENSYETISSAQQIYGSSLVASQGNFDDVKRAGVQSVYMHGMLDEARSEAIAKQYANEEDAQNRALEKKGEWRNYLGSAAMGVGVAVGSAYIVPAGAAAAVAVPLGFESLGGVGETEMATNTIDWLHEREYSNDQESDDAIVNAKERGQYNAMIPLLNYADEKQLTNDQVDDWCTDAEGKYNDGADKIRTATRRG